MSNDDFSGDKKKGQAPKHGRRATKASNPAETSLNQSISVAGDADEEVIDKIIRPPQSKSEESVKPRPAMKGGWADSRGDGASDDYDDDRRLRARSPQDHDADSDNDIPMIPELEDSAMTTAGHQVTMAPNIAVNRITTYKELDNELLKHVAFLTLDNEIDLKLLSNGLSGEADLIEEDVPWEWDQLFTEVMSDLTTEWDAQEIGEDKTLATVAA